MWAGGSAAQPHTIPLFLTRQPAWYPRAGAEPYNQTAPVPALPTICR